MTPATQTPTEERLLPEPAISQIECNCPDDCERDHEND
jgi:hypothetical protein